MKRHSISFLLLFAAGCGTGAPAGSEIPADLEVWQITTAGENNLFTLGVDKGSILILGDSSGARQLAPPVAFDASKSPLQVGFRVQADLFGIGATELTEVLLVGQLQQDGSFTGVVQIRAVNRENVLYSQTCTIHRVV